MDHFISMVRYSLRVLMLGFFLSSLTWVPHVYHSFILFFSVSLPNIISVAVAPKCLFVVSNLIVIFLFGESKLGKCTKKNEHECMTVNEKVEYFGVERKVLSYENSKETNVGNVQENNEVEVVALVEERDNVEIVAKREEIGTPEDAEEVKNVCEAIEMREYEEETESVHEEMEREEEETETKEDEDKMEREHEELDREEEELECWPTEELNRKVEDFIAKVNMQIRLEARMAMAISCY